MAQHTPQPLLQASRHSIAILSQYYCDISSDSTSRTPFFALIGAPIEGKQKAQIFCDDNHNPRGFLVVTPFGFSQVICIDDDFCHAWFERVAYALHHPQNYDFNLYQPTKIRLLAVDPQLAQLLSADNMYLAERVQWDLASSADIQDLDVEVKRLDKNAIDKVNQALDFKLDSRFWPSAEAFAQFAVGYYWQSNNEVLGACYSCAISQNRAEVDIMTVAVHQGRGIGFKLAKAYIAACIEQGLAPKWDCFTNNLGSMKLAKALGFVARTPYIYITIDLGQVSS